MTGVILWCRLNKEWNAEMERRQQLRAKAGPQFQKGPTELDRRLPQGLTGATPKFLHVPFAWSSFIVKSFSLIISWYHVYQYQCTDKLP